MSTILTEVTVSPPDGALDQADGFKIPYQGNLLRVTDRTRQAGTVTGSQNSPLTSATTLDADQSEVVHAASQLQHACESQYSRRVRGQEENLHQLESSIMDESGLLSFTSLISNCKSEFSKLFADNKVEILTLQKDYLEISAALKAFKKTHARTQPADYPVSWKAHYYLLATIAIVESLINIAFYGEYKGVTTAFMIAGGASIANVVVAAAIGTRWRFKNSLRSSDRTMGWAFFGVWAIYLFGLNKFLAVFRAALESSIREMPSGDPILQASQTAFNFTFSYPAAGFHLLDISSWFLFIFGLIIGVGAFIKGYYGDDIYPGYGHLHRRYVAAQDEFSDFISQLKEKNRANIQSVEFEISKYEKEKQRLATEFAQMAQLINKTLNDYNKDTTSISADLNYLIKLYRDSNREVRMTPAPDYFNKSQKLSVVEIRISDKWKPENLDRTRERLNSLIARSLETCSEHRVALAKISQENGTAIDNILKEIEINATRELGGFMTVVGQ